ncbi:hypothetical protein HZH68_015699 [Vespula germanica]|uniref:Uncharacterized protein n=1 Tax=Vespula germanica TaxID=30212 RepID=A0A834JA24_VESGE|nr:hypothetical protein HZH68_015699 [Vespula germanica]
MLTHDSRVSNMKFERFGTSDKQDRLDGKHKNGAQDILDILDRHLLVWVFLKKTAYRTEKNEVIVIPRFPVLSRGTRFTRIEDLNLVIDQYVGATVRAVLICSVSNISRKLIKPSFYELPILEKMSISRNYTIVKS